MREKSFTILAPARFFGGFFFFLTSRHPISGLVSYERRFFYLVNLGLT